MERKHIFMSMDLRTEAKAARLQGKRRAGSSASASEGRKAGLFEIPG